MNNLYQNTHKFRHSSDFTCPRNIIPLFLTFVPRWFAGFNLFGNIAKSGKAEVDDTLCVLCGMPDGQNTGLLNAHMRLVLL